MKLWRAVRYRAQVGVRNGARWIRTRAQTIPKRKVVVTAAVCAPLAVALLFLSTFAIPPAQAPAAPEEGVLSAAVGAIVGEDCVVQYTTLYTLCGHTTTQETPVPHAWWFQTREQVAMLAGGWEITSFASDRIEMRRSLALYCPQHSVLALAGEQLTVYQTEGDQPLPTRAVNMPYASIPDDARAQLAPPGVAFDSLEAVEEWLESIES